MGVNSRVELAVVNAAMRRRLLERLMLAGVTVEDPETHLRRLGRRGRPRHAASAPARTCSGRTTVGAASEIGPGSVPARRLRRRPRPRGQLAPATSASIGSGCSVGPFAYIRPNTVLAEGAKAGTFVEIKNSRIGEGSKVPHLSYVGDAVVGARQQHRRRQHHRQLRRLSTSTATTIGDGVRTGSDTDARRAGHHRRRRLHGAPAR